MSLLPPQNVTNFESNFQNAGEMPPMTITWQDGMKYPIKFPMAWDLRIRSEFPPNQAPGNTACKNLNPVRSFTAKNWLQGSHRTHVYYPRQGKEGNPKLLSSWKSIQPLSQISCKACKEKKKQDHHSEMQVAQSSILSGVMDKQTMGTNWNLIGNSPDHEYPPANQSLAGMPPRKAGKSLCVRE